jgi:hypothetical protein
MRSWRCKLYNDENNEIFTPEYDMHEKHCSGTKLQEFLLLSVFTVGLRQLLDASFRGS